MNESISVVIIRDRESAGGGIYNYYNSIDPHLRCRRWYVDVGRPQPFYQGQSWFERHCLRWTPTRLLFEWSCLVICILSSSANLVHINPGLDARKQRSLRRDAVSVLIAKILRRPVLVFWRGWAADWVGQEGFPGGNQGLICRIYKSANAHIVLSETFKKDLTRWGFTSPIYVETTVVSGEIALGDFKTRSLNAESVELLFLSRIEEAKGIFELLEAFKILNANGGRYRLTYAGDGPHLELLRQRVEGMEGIRLLGYVTGAEKTRCFHDASIFCFLSSYGEGMPNAVLEAMAAGLPVIASDAGGLRDILKDGVTGFIIPQNSNPKADLRFSPELAARRIRELVVNPQKYSQISEHNMVMANNRFTASAVAGRIQDIYCKTLRTESNGAL